MDISLSSIPEDLRLRYLARRSQDIKDCLFRLNSLDWAYFERLGHQLKGNAPSYGYSELGRIAARMEQHAKDRDLEGLESSLSEFKSWITGKSG